MSRLRVGLPTVTGISPLQGVPGTQITIRGENLGTEASDLVAFIICGTDCLMSAKWKSSSKIIARLGQAKRGVGDIIIVTRSGGKGISNVQFRVLIEEVGPLQESSVWVDESRTVPGRNVVRNIQEVAESEDVLGLKIDPQKRLDQSVLFKMFPECSGNLRLENFRPAWYLLENHKHVGLEDLRIGLKTLNKAAIKGEETTKNVHKANLNSLINCVKALSSLHGKIEGKVLQKQKNSNFEGWPMTKVLEKKITESKETADKLFREVLNRKDKADATRNALSVLTRFRFIFFLAELIDENMAKGEFSTILNDYTRAKSIFKDSEVGLFKEVLIVLDEKIESLKQTIRQKLIDVPTSFETQSKLIKYLKILDPESDPAWDCITAYHCWLEDVLWQIQDKFYNLVLEERRQQKLYFIPSTSNRRSSADVGDGYRQMFTTELLSILTEKLEAFWKLAQSYLNESTDDRFHEKREDVDQMLKNTINVSSWLLLNALVPTSLPDSVSRQYKDQFVSWPKMTLSTQMEYLFFSLRCLRSSIKCLLEHQFTKVHVQPLIELSMTIRYKCLGLVIEQECEAITLLANRENWKTDVVMENGNEQFNKTSLPDLFVTEINEVMPNIKQILSFNNFVGEIDLFSRDGIRNMIIDLFVVLLLSYKNCCDELLQLKGSMSLNEAKRRNRSLRGDSSGENTAKKKGGVIVSEITGRKQLICICNVEYVMSACLPAIGRRLTECGVRFADSILKTATTKMTHYRDQLVKRYIAAKSTTIISLVTIANYDHIPLEDDVSDFIKELIMCVVFIQTELHLIFPQLRNNNSNSFVDIPKTTTTISSISSEVYKNVVEKVLEGVVQLIAKVDLSAEEIATQVVIDLTALEESFTRFLTAKKRLALNSIRARLMNKLDKESFQASMHHYRVKMAMAIESLHSADDINEPTLDDGGATKTGFHTTTGRIIEQNESGDNKSPSDAITTTNTSPSRTMNASIEI